MHLISPAVCKPAFVLLLLLAASYFSFSQDTDSVMIKIEQEAKKLMREGDIPGLAIMIVKDKSTTIRTYGYADLAGKKAVTPKTIFQIGSCSKAFTALAVAHLIDRKQLRLEDKVSDYLPWFWVHYKGKKSEITIAHLLHHTSGIPWNTISMIPQTDAPDALEKTVRTLRGQKLRNLPGKQYEYATINYDVLALIIQVITGQPFEKYVWKNIIDPLQLRHTTIGYPADSSLMSTGYKIGFFSPREYEAPVFAGNNAAGYVYTNAADFSKWLAFQMGLTGSKIYHLAQRTHQRDETVPLHDMAAYAMGWNVSLNGKGEIYHGGTNPNFTAYVAFRPPAGTGVAVLANSNSNYTYLIGENIMKILAGEKAGRNFDPGDNNDKVFSTVSFLVAIYLLVVVALVLKTLVEIVTGKRKFERPSRATGKSLLISIAIVFPFLYGIYLFPRAFAGFSWTSILVWAPVSFYAMVVLILSAIAISFLSHIIGSFFPAKNIFRRQIPQVLLLSILVGISNMVIIAIVTSAIYNDEDLVYIIFYYVLALGVYLLGGRFVQITLTRLNTQLVYDMRTKLTEKIFSTSYQQFEKIDRGRVYTALNDDINTLADSTNLVVSLVTGFFTATAAFFYLATIAFWATMLMIFLIITISAVYYFASKSTNKYFEEARDTQNVFMRLINGLIDGFKEISLHHKKKLEYRADIAETADKFRNKIVVANIRFINAFLIGESLLVVLLGSVVFTLPRIFPGLQLYTVMSFVVVLLYLIGPVNSILNAMPGILRIRIAWNRMQRFLKDIPANKGINQVPVVVEKKVNSIRAEKVEFRYDMNGEPESFAVGPVNLEVKSGEILFIIGGNGSGKSTLAKLLTGLYEPTAGNILIDNRVVKSHQLSEHFSAVFSPAYLFEKLYNVDIRSAPAAGKKYLDMLHLSGKVTIDNNKYSTLNLSGGQRKRLALLQCYLEDAPIYLFDEWAADQDPEYRRFFYRTLLPEMKERGKIIIAITHDDHYFDVADKVIKMNEGKPNLYQHQ